MENNNTGLAKKLSEISKQLHQTVYSVIGQEKMEGFEKAYTVSNAIGQLKTLLTAEYMKPIMELQNNKLGFKTDKAAGGYDEAVVKNCLIEAVLTGVQPTGNQFNIIAGNCYITKEGFGYMLANMKNLAYEIVPGIPKNNADKTGAIIPMTISWNYNGNPHERTIEFPIKMNQYMGADAIIGKATRKARAWLYNNLNETEISDGDIEDVKGVVVETKPLVNEEEQRILSFLETCDSLVALTSLESDLKKENDLYKYTEAVKEKISAKKLELKK